MMSAQQARVRASIRRPSSFSAAGSSSESVMPFDHAASFELTGIPGNIVQDVINISNDGTFVAVAIGYGFEEDRARPAPLEAPTSVGPGKIRLSAVPVAALIEGFRLNPRLERLVFKDLPASTRGRSSPVRERTFSDETLSDNQKTSIVQRMKPTEEISFLFSIVDSGTGRELQDEPIHNIAALGKSNGERPFRMLAQPLTFQPRSTIRLQIVERSESVQGTLFIVLYGYKILTGCIDTGNRPFAVGSASQSERIIPFDYVSSFQLTGTPHNLIDDEVPINVEGGFVATSIGYGLAVESLDVAVNKVTTDTVNVGELTFDQFPTSALQGGIRVRPNFHRIAFANGGGLNTVPRNVVDRLFERLNRPEDVSFRYSIFDTGTGRELQNQPINNIAGLGIANGDRPFKRLARPMLFQPRSTIRLTVEEQSGRGTLFIVFQGYKLLGGPTVSQTATLARRTRRR
jgi:hypothetical protein